MEVAEGTSKSFILYPIYFDADKTVAEGRRLPKGQCKKNPQARDLLLAAQSVGFSAELEQNKSHPKSAIGSGRVKVSNVESISKNQLMIKIASHLPKVSSTPTVTANINVKNDANIPKNVPSASKTVEIAPNVVYQVRSKKNKKNK